MADQAEFWSSIKTVAAAFRESDPSMSGRFAQLVVHFDRLPPNERVQLRLDVQLLGDRRVPLVSRDVSVRAALSQNP